MCCQDFPPSWHSSPPPASAQRSQREWSASGWLLYSWTNKGWLVWRVCVHDYTRKWGRSWWWLWLVSMLLLFETIVKKSRNKKILFTNILACKNSLFLWHSHSLTLSFIILLQSVVVSRNHCSSLYVDVTDILTILLQRSSWLTRWWGVCVQTQYIHLPCLWIPEIAFWPVTHI